MQRFLKSASLCFAAGCIGGLANSLALWIFGLSGITGAFGVKLAPALTPMWLYPRIVWGGLWGFLFLIPLFRRSYVLKGFIYSLGPTIVQMFIVFPFKANKGIMGIDLGLMTPVFVVILNAIWGVVAAYWIKYSMREVS